MRRDPIVAQARAVGLNQIDVDGLEGSRLIVNQPTMNRPTVNPAVNPAVNLSNVSGLGVNQPTVRGPGVNQPRANLPKLMGNAGTSRP